MKPVTLGKSDIQISSIIMGTWQAGKSMWAGIDDNQTTAAIRAAFEAGITTFDTATVYGNGHSERIIAKAIGDVRHQVVYATKVFANSMKYDQVKQACERSLKDLGTDYIDLYQIHWPSGSFGSETVPMEETMKAMVELKEAGKIRAIGVSNFSRDQLAEAAHLGQIDSLQPPYSLFWRHVEKDTAPYCRENDITILAYSPMAQGILTGKFGPEHKFARSDHRSRNRLFSSEVYPVVQNALEKLRPVADRLGITLGQLALAWVTSHPNTCAIAGARNAEQAKQNAEALDIQLPPGVIAEIETVSRMVTEKLDDNPVQWNW